MIFNEKDKYFFSIILKQGDVFEDVIQKSYSYDIKLEDALINDLNKVKVINKDTGEKQILSFEAYGKYNEDTETFTWFHNLQNQILQDMIQRGIIGDFFKDATTIEKLFLKPDIKIPKEYKNVIPYFLAILISNKNIIPFGSPDSSITMYVGIALDIKDNFNLDAFNEDLEKYNELVKQKRTARIRKTKKKKGNKN